jgi:hypothetical protein
LRADCGALAKVCVPGTPVADLEPLLRQTEDGGDFVFAEERLQQLGPLLGINEEILMSDFATIGVDVDPDEFGVVAIGDVEVPAEDSHGRDDLARQLEMLHARSPLHVAVTQGDLVKIEKLVSEGRDINEIPAGVTTTALALASASQSPDFILRMVELGADVHKGQPGPTPLWFAVQAGKLENVRTLIELGADVNVHNPHVGSLLHAAVLGGSEEMTREMLDAGVDPSQTNAANMTPLQAVELQLNQLQQLKTMYGVAALERIEPVIQKLAAIVALLKAERH